MRSETIFYLLVCTIQRSSHDVRGIRLSHLSIEGPKSNPANLTVSPNTTIEALFSQLFIAAIASDNTVRFLSRYDKSATNIKESAIWTSIGQTPWSYPFSFFYHINPEFPYQAMATAAKLKEYTLIDRGTWYGVEPWIREEMQIFVRPSEMAWKLLKQRHFADKSSRWKVKTTTRQKPC